ncbi:MAG: methylmalonyl-CoA mutase family protein [Chloroflexi bacterium]|nr:methylmalonyl-CoA mutase family protein [Chloroflexota bacterium]
MSTETKNSEKIFYNEHDYNNSHYNEKLGDPGNYPFTRGVYPTMYTGRLWTMRQYSGFGDADETNERFRYLIEQGQTGLSVAFDLPTQLGYDSDDPMSLGEVGKVGVVIDSLYDMERLFSGIKLADVSTSMTINAPALVLLAMYAALGEKQGADISSLRGTIQNDILKEYMARGTYIFPPEHSLRLITDSFRAGKQYMPHWNIISISGYHIREAGSTAVQEVAFTLANGIAYVERALEAGLEVDDFAGNLSFFFGVHNDLIEEVAKFRAARRIWAKIMKERFGAQNAKSMMLRFHSQTCGSTLTSAQPMNNLIRVTIQALAAVLGGTQSLHTNSWDEALALPSIESVRLALRTQQIIGHESGVPKIADPLGGSYAVETITGRIEEEASKYIENIDRMGGVLAGLKNGYFKREIENSAYDYQKEIESEKRVVVGVNKFTSDEKAHVDLEKPDPMVEKRQVERLREHRKNRDEGRVKSTLAALEDAAGNPEGKLFEPVFEAVKSYATLGEICGVLRSVFGEWRDA